MRKFKVFIIADNSSYGMIPFSSVADTRADELIRIILNTHRSLLNAPISGENFQVLAYRHEKWLKNEDLINKLSSKESILAIIAESQRKEYKNSIESLKAFIDLIMETNPNYREQYQANQPGLNDMIMLKPNISGIGIDFNKVMDFLKKKKN
ncbi:MAG: hypothetical protein WC406_08330 [Methanoregula sp.]|jgi:hypothetical protein|nr:hypothetical protein [Methanoregula sp.]